MISIKDEPDQNSFWAGLQTPLKNFSLGVLTQKVMFASPVILSTLPCNHPPRTVLPKKLTSLVPVPAIGGRKRTGSYQASAAVPSD